MKAIYIALLVVSIVGVNVWADKRDKELMSLCANHQTRTLYKC